MIQQEYQPGPELSEHEPLLRDGEFNSNESIYHSTLEREHNIIKNQGGGRFPALEDEGSSDNDDTEPAREVPPGFWGVVACLLIGVIVASIDTSLVMATFGQIGSEFGRLDDSNWMIVGYQLGVLATQPMMTKQSSGTSTEFWHLIVGRVISGIGGGGMTSVVSILLNDLVPLRDLAAWRSYVYIAATVGRSCGAPLGGLMVDTIGWRWSFLGQVPLALLAITMVSLKLNIAHKKGQQGTQTFFQRLQRIDFIGAASLAVSLTLLLIFLDEAGKRMSSANSLLITCGIGSLVFGVVFLYVETYVATEPILPPRIIIQRDVFCVYSTLGVTTGSQISFVSTVSIYFVITLGVSNVNAAARLVFGNVAHALGGLTAGILIRRCVLLQPYAFPTGWSPSPYCLGTDLEATTFRTGWYKRYIVIAMSISTFALLLVTIRWRGNTNIFETAYIAPAGFGIGMINTAAFIALSASVEQKDQAIATSGFYLSDNLGFVVISSLGNAVLQMALASRLNVRLEGVPNKQEIIRDVVTSISNIKNLDPTIRGRAIKAFIEALQWDHGLSTVIYAISLFVVIVFLREYSFEGR
ncbi:hypothetical protein TWF730_009206 [Orbilia blumenaviensis]|uniref:Major facilitator superfamily (MFS) profile domain-containing protein n=1 Tax=Orbilia blumenaviensis TaxID=1796055 RepID=A0AAV9UYB3_9PEZI